MGDSDDSSYKVEYEVYDNSSFYSVTCDEAKKVEDNSEINELNNQLNKLNISKSEINEEDFIDCEWYHIFKELKYDGNSEIIISSKQIKDCKKSWKSNKKSQFEPRLLCKQDSDDERPEIFKKYGLCIISIKNGLYLLTKYSIYQPLEYNTNSNICKLNNKNNNILLLKMGNSESSKIDNIRYTGLFETSEYLGEEIIGEKLLSGRHRCTFNTKINDKEINVEGSQYETDAAYESENKILVIECKNDKKPESFNIRQLYYPYRSIYDVIACSLKEKEIIPIFIYAEPKDKKIIHIWKYKFSDPLVMSSIELINYSKYQIDE
jgi:hypothetical protein